MQRWFPRLLGVILFLCPLGCRQYRENWCMDHGFVHANQAQQQAAPPVAPVAYPPAAYAPPVAPVSYAQPAYAAPAYGAPQYGATQYCVPPPSNYCPPGMAVPGTTTWR